MNLTDDEKLVLKLRYGVDANIFDGGIVSLRQARQISNKLRALPACDKFILEYGGANPGLITLYWNIRFRPGDFLRQLLEYDRRTYG